MSDDLFDDPKPDTTGDALEKQGGPDGTVVDDVGQMRVGLRYLMQHPDEFGYAMIVPESRFQAPKMPFWVDDSDLRTPEQKYALLKRRRETDMIHGGEVIRGDVLIHISSGMICVCVERVSQWNFRVECIVPPQTKPDLEAFLKSVPYGCGQWVVVGVAATAFEVQQALKEQGFVNKAPQLVQGQEAVEAFQQVKKNPDAKGWGEQGKHIAKDPKKIKSKATARYSQFVANMAGKTISVNDLERDATFKTPTRDGKGMVYAWNTMRKVLRDIRGE